MRSATRAVSRDLVCLCVCLLAVACSTRSVAHTEWDRGGGPALIDLERPIIVEKIDSTSSLDVLFPILFLAEAEGRYFGPCGLRLTKVTDEVAAELKRIGKDREYDGSLLGARDLLSAPDTVEVIQNSQIQTRRWRRSVPLEESDMNEAGALTTILYAEVESLGSSAGAENCTSLTGTGPGRAVRSYLVELGSARSTEGVAFNLAAAWWGVAVFGGIIAWVSR